MGDIFKEQIVKRKPTTGDMVKKIGLAAAVLVIFIVSSPYLGQFAIFITFAAGFGAYILMGRLNVEYEYIFTNGDLDIDIIYNRTQRKRLFTGRVSDFEVMAHVTDNNHAGDFSSAVETKDYSSGVVSDITYAFLTFYKNKRTKIIFEPNEMMMKAISSALTPRKLFKKP